ncbi:MAG: transcriptional repressor LexA [Candidatus Omnitrophica bacterium]|nr:transcriptional repressor LexA [Candidatus Omnitrophota bacterium]
MAKQLTKRQHTVLETIRGWIRQRGYPPTIREIGKSMGIKSLRGVTTHLDAIAKKGFLKREPRARSISLLDIVAPFEQALWVPIVGRVRAGEPVLAQQNVEGHLVVDGSWIGKTTTAAAEAPAHFALKVKGDSMINAGILEGDFVIVRQQPTVDNGEIAVALLGDEATVKRFFKEDDQIRLQPEHPSMEPILVTKQQPLSILGKVVGVFRHLP